MLAVVSRADPDYQRLKARDIEYEFTRKVFYGNRQQRGAYDTPKKISTVAYSGPATFVAGDLTGVGYDFVELHSTSLTPGVLTTRTGAQMFGDIVNAQPLMQWCLRVANIAEGAPLTFAGGQGVTILVPGTPPNATWAIPRGTFSDFIATLADVADVTLQLESAGNSFSSVNH